MRKPVETTGFKNAIVKFVDVLRIMVTIFSLLSTILLIVVFFMSFLNGDFCYSAICLVAILVMMLVFRWG